MVENSIFDDALIFSKMNVTPPKVRGAKKVQDVLSFLFCVLVAHPDSA